MRGIMNIKIQIIPPLPPKGVGGGALERLIREIIRKHEVNLCIDFSPIVLGVPINFVPLLLTCSIQWFVKLFSDCYLFTNCPW